MWEVTESVTEAELVAVGKEEDVEGCEVWV
jgi:hypothetical protein